VTGSYLLGVASPTSDIDVVCVGFVEKGKFWEGLKKACRKWPDVEALRVVTDAVFPVAKVKLQCLANGKICEYDVSYHQLPETISIRPKCLKGVAKELKTTKGNNKDKAMTGWTDGMALLEDLHSQKGRYEKFQVLVDLLRQWRNKRRIHSNGFCYLGSFSWCLLIAVYLRNAKETPSDPTPLFSHFFNFLQTLDFTQPISITSPPPLLSSNKGKKEAAKEKREKGKEAEEVVPMTVLTPSPPHANSTRNVTGASLRVLLNEIHRVTKLNSGENKASWDEIAKSLSLISGPPQSWCVVFHFYSTHSPADLDEHVGWLMSKSKRVSEELFSAEIITRWIPDPFPNKKLSTLMYVLKCWPADPTSKNPPTQGSSAVISCFQDLVTEFDDQFKGFKGQFVFKQRTPKQLAEEFTKK
jgi:poly(A) polymerase Pap1